MNPVTFTETKYWCVLPTFNTNTTEKPIFILPYDELSTYFITKAESRDDRINKILN
jgi:hypothetical protein